MLLSAEKITKSYSEKILLNGVSLYLNEGDKIGVIGVNGTGKSTFLNIIAQMEDPDSGTISKNPGVRIEYLQQNPVWNEKLTLLEHVFQGTATALRQTKEYEAKTVLTKLGLTEYDTPISRLSGGQRKRAAIASALIHPCEVLILDEPTNHLDNQMVMWLENYLSRYTGAIIMVTHDRYFLDRVTNKIIELDHGNLYSYQANYSRYLEMKAQREEVTLGTERKNKSLLRKEYEWMQQGPKARGTKSKDRIARFENLSDSIGRSESAKLELSSMSTRLGKKTLEITDISKSFGGREYVSHFSHIISRDARIGIVGKNGCGKSTLLNMISGRLLPDSGTVVFGETVKLGYFSQDSQEMDVSLRVIDFIRNIAETIETRDGPLSASQMLEKFLFTPDLQWNTIKRLSGGERRRLYLLSIIMEAPNFLLLDEPTNDLDIQTLTILEEYLENFNGAVITVSHDRYFLDKAVDTIFDFQDDGTITKYLGSYSEYLEQNEADAGQQAASEAKTTQDKCWNKNRKLKFTYNEQREYEKIDSDIADLETQLYDVSIDMHKESSNYIKLQELMEKKESLEQALDGKMSRWVYLNDLAEKIAETDS
ncbi:MAG: ABC-F family ATP-binding cassette domain-containing protein [Eubacteriales bacterium]